MKAWAVATAALSLTALCAACSSTEDEKAPDSSAAVEDQWKYHVKKSYPQWQAPAEVPPATAAQQQTKASAGTPAAQTARPAVEEPAQQPLPPGAQPPPAASDKPVPANTVFVEPPGFVVNNNIGTYVSPKPEPVKGDGFSHYTVKRGDSLWSISKLVYHRADKWDKIYEVNKDVVKDPNKLKPGSDLKIPAP